MEFKSKLVVETEIKGDTYRYEKSPDDNLVAIFKNDQPVHFEKPIYMFIGADIKKFEMVVQQHLSHTVDDGFWDEFWQGL